MANASGVNQFGGFSRDAPYGDVARQTQLTRSAPMSGAPVPALEAPRRAKRQALRGGEATPPAEAPAAASGPPPVAAGQNPALWEELSSMTNDPLVAYYAEQARRSVG